MNITQEAQAVAWLTLGGGWGAWIKVTVADTPEALRHVAEVVQ